MKRKVWQEVSTLIDQGTPVIMAWDFNYIDKVEDKRGGHPFAEDTASREFTHFLQSNGLIDMGSVRPRFTWYNNRTRGARVWECIDRVFANLSWLHLFPHHLVRYLPIIASDHYLILLSTAPSVASQISFRFEKFWLQYPRSWKIVREVWMMPVHGDARYRITQRLELVKRRLHHRNRVEVGNISVRL